MDAYRAQLQSFDQDIADAIRGEERRQSDGVEMIPSENYTYPEVLAALGSVLTNKYSEGYPGRRYYGGQQYTDAIEELARARARALFRCEHANVQPLSGSPMNQAVYFAFLRPGDTVLAMDLSHGGHLTHGAPVSHMGRVFRFVRYRTVPDEAGRIDFDEVRRLARETRPKIVLCGYTSYPRDYDYAGFKAIADEVGALTMADISHVGGLVAAGVLQNPFDFGFDVVGIPTNKQIIPDAPTPPLRPSGVRLGTPAATTRGMREPEMRRLGGWIADTVCDGGDAAVLERRRCDVAALCERFPVPGL